MSRGDIIFALASGAPPSGISVFRISGQDIENLVEALLQKIPKPRVAQLGPVYDFRSHNIIDYGLALWFPSPKSFTGEDCLELHLHGSRAVHSALMDSLSAWPNCRLAEAGEFTLRALKNNKMNIMEVEAVSDLLQSETEAQRVQAISAFNGIAISLIDSWKKLLIQSLALIEASLDFSDESDIPSNVLDQFWSIISDIELSLKQTSVSIERAEIIRDGFRVAIIGRPNAGKSSLLNYFAGRDAAIVSEYAGTTRDIIDIKINLGGLPVVFYDTAGLRETSDPVEKIGIERTFKHIEKAHLILCLDENGEFSNFDIPSSKKSIHVRTKIDLYEINAHSDIAISTVSGTGISLLLDAIESEAKKLTNSFDTPIFFNQRQNTHISKAIDALARIKCLDLNLQTDLIAEDLRIALYSLESLIGKIDAEDILGHIFSSFCIGK